MMHLVLFIFYFLLLCFAITRLRFFSGYIRPVYLVLLFGIHVAAGCIHNWIAFRFYPHHGDIWLLYELSPGLKQLLLTNPIQFFTGFFSNAGQFNIADTSQPMLGVQYNILVYLNVFLDCISFNNLYINTLLFSFPVFAGTVALFKVFYAAFNKPLPAFCTLLLPSVLFWTSVVYKDGLFCMAIGYFCYYLLQAGKPLRKGILLLVCIAVIVLSRANALITLLPAMFFLFLTEKKMLGKPMAFCLSIASVIVTAIIFNMVMTEGILTAVCERQRDFRALTGGSRIYLPALAPTAGSFLAVFPVALVNGFLQPLPGAGGKSIYTAFSVELLVIWAIILFACWLLIRKKTFRFGSFGISCLLFALPSLTIIGYMVPFAGAIIRYRSIYLPFLLAPFLNIICNYPVTAVQAVNDWLWRNVMVTEIKTAH
jgi:hypothetical protein